MFDWYANIINSAAENLIEITDPFIILLIDRPEGRYFFLIITLFLIAIPIARHRNWKTFFLTPIKVFLIVIVPLFTFILGVGLTPFWKVACNFGAFDCFHTGKIALLPFALWATAALYLIEAYKVKNRKNYWIVIGVLHGALISIFCLIHGLLTIDIKLSAPYPELIIIILLPPIYVSIWYSWRLIDFLRKTDISFWKTAAGVIPALPFWHLSFVMSYKIYDSLKATSECFIVTAAARGHEKIVGPYIHIQHSGRFITKCNRQLLTFWKFESIWSEFMPFSHKLFRKGYNVLGPFLAKMVYCKLIADIVYLALKPAEIIALLAVKLSGKNFKYDYFKNTKNYCK